MMKKDIKKEVNTLTYLKRVKGIGIFGVVFSIVLIIYDAIVFSNWMSVVSLIVDGLLLIFSIYFIIKSVKLSEREKIAIEKTKEKSEIKEKKTSSKSTKKGKK